MKVNELIRILEHVKNTVGNIDVMCGYDEESGVITGASIDLAVDEIGLRLTGDED